MNEAVLQMLKKYSCQTHGDYKNALKEIIQEIALLGLWRAKFFEKAAFYGGTALRILYKLDRFSEDLDFSLLKKIPSFDISYYENAIVNELKSFGFKVQFTRKMKATHSPIQSAFLKANTLEHFLMIDLHNTKIKKMHRDEHLKIKLEIDTDPPTGFATESHYLLYPTTFSVKAFSKPDLFAGKVHALLFRPWKHRVKGRDWYDFVWFIKNGTPLNFQHLKKRILQTEKGLEKLTKQDLIVLLQNKIDKLSIEDAKKDILPFIKNPDEIEIWSVDFFLQLVDRITFLESS